jgi:hypothetical protein
VSAGRSNKPRDLVQIAAAIVGSAAAAQVIPGYSLGEQVHDGARCHNAGQPHLGPCIDPSAGDFPCCDQSGIGAHDSTEHGDTQCNSYETTRVRGFDVDGMTTSYTGVNGRRILIREDADGVYVGGVLFGSSAELAEFARLLDTAADY